MPMLMDDSLEDVYSDTISQHSGRSKGDYMNLSRFTIYHSATDLDSRMGEDSIDLVNDSNPSSPRRDSEPHSPKPCPMMFHDGERTVDFVLVWWKQSLKAPSQNGAHNSFRDAELKRLIFERHLEIEGLELERESSDKLNFVKIHAPREVLCRYCEIMKMRMPMRELPGQDELLGSQFNLITEMKSLLSMFVRCANLDSSVFPPDKFRPSAEYSRDKNYLFDENSEDFFSSTVRTLVVDFILERQSFSENARDAAAVGIKKLIADGVYSAAYPLHDGDINVAGSLRNLLYKEWAQVSKWIMYQPIDQIKEYFGASYALYFAWLGFYTHMLIPASIVGLLCFLYGCFTLFSDTLSADICDKSSDIIMCPRCDVTCDYWRLSDTCWHAKITYLFDNPITVVFAVFMSFWATLFLELWKRYSASITHRWGLTGFTAQSEHPRPQYLAKLSKSKRKRIKINVVTGAKEPYAPFWTVRLPAICLSFSVVLLLVLLAVGAVFGVVLYRMSVLTSISLMGDKDFVRKYSDIIIPITAAIINLLCIVTLNWVYDRLAVWLTELELLRTQTEFDESLTVKIYLFQFVNYYTSIMYIAFLKGKFVGYPAKYNRILNLRQEECNPGGCLMELFIQLAIIMIGQQAFNSILEMVLPFGQKWWNSFMLATGLDSTTESDENIDKSIRKQWTEDYKLLDWGDRGLFSEYLEMVMQYGFVTIFVSAFPLAPVFALLNNVLEMRLDAKKFLTYYRRPIPRRAPNIGVWFRILDVLGKFAVISNAFIIAFSSNFIPRLVYMSTVSEDHTDVGFLNNSLSYFDTSDFPEGLGPRNPTFNVSICRYGAYRNPPDVMPKYKRTVLHWHILAARLCFIVVFQVTSPLLEGKKYLPLFLSFPSYLYYFPCSPYQFSRLKLSFKLDFDFKAIGFVFHKYCLYKRFLQ
uniref:Anoctamin n=1 Tax=Clastoptera arizonana TaxID=38151 RepID=A0A1B6ED36_9HEMI